ncbi:MAG: peptidylprolyl isomerase [Bacteroides sp.]|nr:peptidylprolyl isomerase [Bacteroides sp.]
MKPWCLFVFLCGIFSFSFAQETSVLTVNDRHFRLSELEWLYRHTGQAGEFHLFPEHIIHAQLKVQEAIREGLDTTVTYQRKVAAYRRDLLFRLMTAGKANAQSSREEKVRILHAIHPLPQNLPRSAVNQAEQRMRALRQVWKEIQGEDACRRAADSCSVRCIAEWIHRLDLPRDMEQRIFSLDVREISEPFFSPWGIHVVQVLDKRMETTDPREAVSEASFLRQWREEKIEELKQRHSFSLHEEGISDLFLNGYTSQELFSYRGRSYTGVEFSDFRTHIPYSLRKQLEWFVDHTLLSDEAAELMDRDMEYRMAILHYSDSLLIRAITERKIVPLLKDTIGLQTYFETHRPRYKWELPRFRGVVLHTSTKKIAREVKKFLKKLPESEWESALALTFNGVHAPRVCFEQGEYAIGQNAYVDKIVFKQGGFSPVGGYPVTTLVGKKVSGPADWTEVQERVIREYGEALENNWLKELRKKSVVEINEEVLKTVNNH